MALVLSLSAGFGAGHASADTVSNSFNLPRILVEDAKITDLPGGFVADGGTVGLMGSKNVMDVPFSQTSVSEKTINLYGGPNQPLDSALAGVPSIRQAGSVLHNDFTMRGFRANGTSMYVNGVHGMLTQFNATMIPFERADVLAGPNSGLMGSGVQYESSAAGGTVNLISKKATKEPITRYKQTFSGKSSTGEFLDIGRRFGKNDSWGLRLNTELMNGETAVDGTYMKTKGVYMNLDHFDDRSKTNLLAGYRDVEIEGGMRWFKIGPNLTKFPAPIKASRNYAFDGMVKGAYGYFMVLNHEQMVNKDWKVFFNGGVNRNKLNKNVMSFRSAYTIKNDAGDFDLQYQSTATPQRAFYGQFGTTGTFKTAEVEHELTLAVDKAWRNRDASTPLGFTGSFGNLGTGNIYTGVLNQTSYPDGRYKTGLINKTSIWGVSVLDSMKYEKWGTVLGFHKHQGTARSFNRNTGKETGRTVSSATCPTYALTYTPDEHVMVYGSHSENFDLGAVAGSQYANVGEILPPSKTKQNEIGVKYMNNDFLATLALYDITQANNISVTEGGKDYLRQDGKENHKGIELGLNGKIAPKWNAMVGVTYMDATYKKTAGGKKDGKQASGQPHWSSSVGLEYCATDDFSLLGRVNYTGSTPLFNTNSSKQFFAPQYATLDLGMSYKTELFTLPAKLSFMCYNVTDKDYWMVSRGDNIYASTPRTFFASAEFNI